MGAGAIRRDWTAGPHPVSLSLTEAGQYTHTFALWRRVSHKGKRSTVSCVDCATGSSLFGLSLLGLYLSVHRQSEVESR